MAVALAVQSVENSRRSKKVVYKLTFSGSYSTGGDTLDLTAATNPNALPGAFWGRVPDYGVLDATPGGNGGEIVNGNALTNWKVKLFSSANTELSAGAYNAAVTGDANVFISIYGKNNI